MNHHNKTVLVVEDNPHVAENNLSVVKSIGANGLQCDSVATALNHLANCNIDLVLLDYNLSDGTAADLFARFEKTDRSPVFILLGAADKRDTDILKQQNLVKKVLMKPVSASLLTTELETELKNLKKNENLSPKMITDEERQIILDDLGIEEDRE